MLEVLHINAATILFLNSVSVFLSKILDHASEQKPANCRIKQVLSAKLFKMNLILILSCAVLCLTCLGQAVPRRPKGAAGKTF